MKTIIVENDHRLLEIGSKKEAVKYGKGAGWCTAENPRLHYKDYSPRLGRLFILNKPHRKGRRPFVQFFFGSRRCHYFYEARKRANAHVTYADLAHLPKTLAWLKSEFDYTPAPTLRPVHLDDAFVQQYRRQVENEYAHNLLLPRELDAWVQEFTRRAIIHRELAHDRYGDITMEITRRITHHDYMLTIRVYSRILRETFCISNIVDLERLLNYRDERYFYYVCMQAINRARFQVGRAEQEATMHRLELERATRQVNPPLIIDDPLRER